MNIYEKLNKVKIEFLAKNVKKTGRNEFSKFDYYELSDILPVTIPLLNTYKLCSYISFDKELASLVVVDQEKTEDKIIITSPMASAQLKGMHEIQNLGAVESYSRRYLYMALLDITDHDHIDILNIGTDEDKILELFNNDYPRLYLYLKNVSKWEIAGSGLGDLTKQQKATIIKNYKQIHEKLKAYEGEHNEQNKIS